MAPPVTTTTLSWIFIFAVSTAGNRHAAVQTLEVFTFPDVARNARRFQSLTHIPTGFT